MYTAGRPRDTPTLPQKHPPALHQNDPRIALYCGIHGVVNRVSREASKQGRARGVCALAPTFNDVTAFPRKMKNTLIHRFLSKPLTLVSHIILRRFVSWYTSPSARAWRITTRKAVELGETAVPADVRFSIGRQMYRGRRRCHARIRVVIR